MTIFFLYLFDYFSHHRGRLFGIMCVVTILLGVFARRLNYQEDITRFFPESSDTQSINRIFDDLKVKDKIVIMITPTDSLAEINRAEMTALCDRMVADVLSGPDSILIEDVMSKIDNEQAISVARYVYQHLPVLVNPSQYALIEARMQPDTITNLLKKSYSRIISPEGSVLKEFIALDPLGIGTPILDSIASMQLNDNAMEVHGEHLFSRDGRTLLWFLTPVYPAGNSSENDRLIRHIEACIHTYASEGSPYTIEFTGGPTFSVYNSRQVKRDTAITISIALIIITFGILLVFRSFKAIPLIVVPTIFGALFSLAGIALIQGEISFISVSAGAVVIGMALSFSIHVLTHYLESRSARSVVEHLTRPLTLGGITTIGAFLALLFTESDILHDLGLFAALTLIGATLFSLIFLPHILPVSIIRKPSPSIQWLDRINSYALESNKWVIGVILLFLLAGLYFSGKVKFSNDMMQLHYNHPKYTAATERFYRIIQTDSELVFIVTIASETEKALTEYAQTNRKLNHIANPENNIKVSHAGLMLLSEKEQLRRMALWKEFWSPERKERVKRLLTERGTENKFSPQAFAPFYAMLEQTAQPVNPSDTGRISKMLLGDWISQDAVQTMIVSRIRISESEKESVYKQLDENQSLVIFDVPHLAKRFISIIRQDFNTVLYLCSIIVFLALWLSYRRLEITLITFLPMACSWIIILGVMGLFHLEFNILNIIISTFIFGLGDDFSIFIMDGLLVDYRSRKNTLAEHKTAIAFSAFTTLVGLGVLIFAKHPGLRSISIISMIGILSVVLIAYTLQPLLFKIFISGRTKRKEFPHTLGSLTQSIYVFTLFLLGCIILSVTSIILRLFWFVNKYHFHRLLMYFSRLVVFSVPHMRNKILNPYGETFKKPAILIANHQSFIDSLAVCMIYPKVLVFTNKWTWNSPFFGMAIRYADFYYIGKGVEDSLHKLQPMIQQGYSVVVFPEGTRSATGKIGRFHKGAFYLAEQMKLDIIPISLIGFNEVMSKTDGFYLKDGGLTVHVGKRIEYSDRTWGNTFQERCKKISAFYRTEFAVLQNQSRDTKNPYYRFKLRKTYAYKGIPVEKALNTELKNEGYYDEYHKLIPLNARICELGCGYGFLPNMLSYLAPERTITAIDSDSEKIALAQTGFAQDAHVLFECDNPFQTHIKESNVIIISLQNLTDYNPSDIQSLLERCASQLLPLGLLIIRHGPRHQEWINFLKNSPSLSVMIPHYATHPLFSAFRKTEGTTPLP